VGDLAESLTRASGLVAAVIAAVALISGFLFSARETGHRRRPAWWLDLHQGLGGLALAAVGVHVVVSLLGSGAQVTIADALVPGIASTDRLAVAWGVIATDLLAGAVFTTWPRRIANRRLWRTIHLGSTAGLLLALLHGYQMGTDSARTAVRVGLVLTVAAVVYATAVRTVDAVMRAGDHGEP
jgi:hypothetical protein